MGKLAVPKLGSLSVASPVRSVALAPCLVAMALGLQILLERLVGPLPPFLCFYLAVTLTTLAGDFVTGLLATLLSAAAVQHFFLSGRAELTPKAQAASLCVFLLTSALLGLAVNQRQRQYCGAMEAAARDASRSAGQLERAFIRQQTILNNLTEGVLLLDSEGRPIEVNEAFQRLTGLTLEHLRSDARKNGDHDSLAEDGTILRGKSHPMWVTAVGRASVHNLKAGLVCADGRREWFLVNGQPIDDVGAGIAAMLTLTEITHLKTMDDEVRSSLNVLQLLTEQMPVSVAMFDDQMRFLATSGRFEETFAVEGVATLHRRLSEVFPAITLGWQATFQRALAGEMISGVSPLFGRSRGNERVVSWRMSPWRNNRELIGGVILVTEVPRDEMAPFGPTPLQPVHIQ